jgi:hypothetical protein
MPIDPNIALGVKPIQFESPVNQMAKMYEMQNAAQSNKLNQMKMDEYTRGVAEAEQFKNALAQSNDETAIRNAFYAKGDVKGYNDYLKSVAEQKKLDIEATNLGYTGQKTQVEAADKKQSMMQSMMRDLSTRPSDANIMAYAEDVEASPLFSPQEKAAVKRRTQVLLSLPMDQRVPELASQGASAGELKPNLINQENVMVNGVPTTRVLQKPAFGGKATTVEGSAAPTYNKPAASTVVNVNNAQEREFEKELGKGQAQKVLTSKASAEDAAQILATNMVGKNLLDKGMITGAGAEFFVQLNKGLLRAGMDFGGADAAQNSQAYGALMAANTAKIIKQFGAGTGLSDADREYALKAAAGDISMDEKAIRKILDINNKAAQNAINKHNRDVSGIKTNIPLAVDVRDYTAGIPEGRTSAAKKGAKTLDDIFK